jgi:Ni,Fe-hydrogenase maturation factor
LQGFVTFLVFIFKDCPALSLKEKIENGKFWIVDRGTGHPTNPRRLIRERPAILADDWEENAKPGRSFTMIADDLSAEELKVVSKPWEEQLRDSLDEIFRLANWNREM